MSKHTVVLRFEDGNEPTYHAGMKALGGSIDSVQFSDALEENSALEEQRDELLEALEGMVDFYSYAEQGPIEAAREVIAKARGE